jgi:5-deoxy-glucuronate isomerase
MQMTDLYMPAGSLAGDGTSCSITPRDAEWDYSGSIVLELEQGKSRVLETGSAEMAVLPFSGGYRVEVDAESLDLAGRSGVFYEVTDWAYVPIDAEVRIRSDQPSQIAPCTAEAKRPWECE